MGREQQFSTLYEHCWKTAITEVLLGGDCTRSRSNGIIVADKHRTSVDGSAKLGKMSVADVGRRSFLSFFFFFLTSHLTAKFVRWMILPNRERCQVHRTARMLLTRRASRQGFVSSIVNYEIDVDIHCHLVEMCVESKNCPQFPALVQSHSLVSHL